MENILETDLELLKCPLILVGDNATLPFPVYLLVEEKGSSSPSNRMAS